MNLARTAATVSIAVALVAASTITSAQSTCCAPAGNDWPEVNGNIGGGQYSSLTQIDKTNINRSGPGVGRSRWHRADYGTGRGSRRQFHRQPGARADRRRRRHVRRHAGRRRDRARRRNRRRQMEVAAVHRRQRLRSGGVPPRRERRPRQGFHHRRGTASWRSIRTPARSSGRCNPLLRRRDARLHRQGLTRYTTTAWSSRGTNDPPRGRSSR